MDMKVLTVIGRKVCIVCGQKVQVEGYNYDQVEQLLFKYKECITCKKVVSWLNQKTEIVASKGKEVDLQKLAKRISNEL